MSGCEEEMNVVIIVRDEWSSVVGLGVVDSNFNFNFDLNFDLILLGIK